MILLSSRGHSVAEIAELTFFEEDTVLEKYADRLFLVPLPTYSPKKWFKFRFANGDC